MALIIVYLSIRTPERIIETIERPVEKIQTVEKVVTQTIEKPVTMVTTVVGNPTTIVQTTKETVVQTIPIERTVVKTVERIITQTEVLPKKVKVCFSRLQDCKKDILYWIKRANLTINVMVYVFTLDDLANALIEAKSRGVSVKVIIEKEEAEVRGSEYQRLLASGINVVLDGNPYLMHHKVAIIDSKIVITGSYNWTLSAEDRNDENLIIFEDKDLAQAYEEEFYRVWKEALS